MNSKWEMFDAEFDASGKLVQIKWICSECLEHCSIWLPRKKRVYHCLKGNKDDNDMCSLL